MIQKVSGEKRGNRIFFIFVIYNFGVCIIMIMCVCWEWGWGDGLGVGLGRRAELSVVGRVFIYLRIMLINWIKFITVFLFLLFIRELNFKVFGFRQ